jgi:3D (Asp-Asp-Asp) domain-containing protein
MELTPLVCYRLCFLALTVVLTASPAFAERVDAFTTTPAAIEEASTLLPAEELPDERHPGAFAVAWGGEAYRRIGDRYWADDGTCWQAIRVTTTCYVPVREQCNDDPEHTAIGAPAFTTYGIAADPSALPYGTVMRIPGYGEFKVDDTGKAMRKDWQRGIVHLDLRIPFQRFDGTWRNADVCNRIARKHGVQEDRIVLVQVPEPVFASVESTDRATP